MEGKREWAWVYQESIMIEWSQDRVNSERTVHCMPLNGGHEGLSVCVDSLFIKVAARHQKLQ